MGPSNNMGGGPKKHAFLQLESESTNQNKPINFSSNYKAIKGIKGARGLQQVEANSAAINGNHDIDEEDIIKLIFMISLVIVVLMVVFFFCWIKFQAISDIFIKVRETVRESITPNYTPNSPQLNNSLDNENAQPTQRQLNTEVPFVNEERQHSTDVNFQEEPNMPIKKRSDVTPIQFQNVNKPAPAITFKIQDEEDDGKQHSPSQLSISFSNSGMINTKQIKQSKDFIDENQFSSSLERTLSSPNKSNFQRNSEFYKGGIDQRKRGFTKIRDILMVIQDERSDANSQDIIKDRFLSQSALQTKNQQLIKINEKSHNQIDYSKSSLSDSQFLQQLEETNKMLNELKKLDEQREIKIGRFVTNDEDFVSFMNSVSHLDAIDQTILEDDSEYQCFNTKKKMIVESMSRLVSIRFPSRIQEPQQKEVINSVLEALEEEDMLFRARTLTLNRHLSKPSPSPDKIQKD